MLRLVISTGTSKFLYLLFLILKFPILIKFLSLAVIVTTQKKANAKIEKLENEIKSIKEDKQRLADELDAYKKQTALSQNSEFQQ